jgi:hypothetical protein
VKDPMILTTTDLAVAMARVSIVGPFESMGWQWHWSHAISPGRSGWLIWATFARPDRDTGEMGRGCSRDEFVAYCASVSSVIKTMWLIIELTVRHEAMESFRVDGVLVFDPHRTIDELKGGA